jgi:hypothetical protein
MKQLLTLLVAIFFSLPLSAGDNKPYGLLTDLIAQTDQTWHNGYRTNIPVWQTGQAVETLQYVEIGSTHPSFSWIVPGREASTTQTAYQIIVADNPRDAASANGNIWDSHLTPSPQSTAVPYTGPPLQAQKNYFWRVRTTTTTGGESSWSDPKAFRTASQLSPYATATCPQVKTLQHPQTLHSTAPSTTFIDFGKAAFGQLLLTLTASTHTDSAIIHLGEQAVDGRINRHPGGTIRYQRHPIALTKGTHTYRIQITPDSRNTTPPAILLPHYIGEVLPFRYCEIENYSHPLTPTDILREFVHYPFDPTASTFESSNDTLNQIWHLCQYTIQATSVCGLYIDGDRERIPYEADALINQLCHYSVDREYAMARRTHEYLLQHPTWPTEWILQAILIAWYDYLYTGDNRFLQANYPLLKARTLTALRDKNQLISTTTGLQTPQFLASIHAKNNLRDIVDWPHTGILGLNKQEGGEADGFVFTHYNTVTNAYHYEALKRMSQIATALNLPDEAAGYQKEATAFLTRFNKQFLDPKRGLYLDGDTTTHASLHANIFPLAFQMAPTGRLKSITDHIKSRQMACSVYGAQFLLDALYNASEADYALHLLTKTDDRSWYNMIRVGSTITLEAWDNKYKPNQDWNHAWGAAPANIIPRQLLGIEPLIPGFNRVRIKPQIASLAWVKATIPTIKGAIHLAIENAPNMYRMQLTIPANMESEVYLPWLSKKYEVKINDDFFSKTTKVKDAPFISLGNLPSGTYTITMTY